MKPDYSASLEFLHRWAPEGPWVLTAIDPLKRGTTTATFHKGDEKKLRRWLTNHGAKKNIYFTVNPVKAEVSKKASRADIAALAWIHVDVDPRVGEDLAQEQERIRRVFVEDLPESIPEPSCVVFSGGGYQGFWRLSNPCEIDGDMTKAEAAKLYNMQVEQLFEADACHNVDRIMRLPGTINRPDKRKREKGRTEALAKVVFFNDNAFELDTDFIPAVPTQTDGSGFVSSTPNVEVSGNVPRLDSLDELGANVLDYCKQVIAQGHDPDDPGKWESRSDAVWYVACELVRSGVDDETIFSVLTDAEWRISAHILEQTNPRRSALRTIERAHEYAIKPELEELNRMHAVIRHYGGACRIVTALPVVVGGIERTEITAQSFADFKNWYSNRVVEVGTNKNGEPIYAPLGKWWTEHSQRRQHDKVVFSPEVDVPGCFNLWRGFVYDSRPGKCDRFLDHIRDNICKGDEEHLAYLMGWMATTVQHPAQQGHTAIVLRGKQGTGKSFFAKTFGRLFGRHFLQVSDPKHLVGSFNAHLRDCLVLFGDEAFYAGDKKHESVLKMLVTEETLTIEAKGVDVTTEPNFVHLIMASNDDWVVPAGASERRYFVLDVSDSKKQNGSYFKAIADELDAGGYEALLHTLRTWDLSDFDVRAMPKTRALAEQQHYSLGPAQAWWFDKLMSGEILRDVEGWPDEVYTQALGDDYNDYITVGPRRGTAPRDPWIFLRRQCGPQRTDDHGKLIDYFARRRSSPGGEHSYIRRNGQPVRLKGRPNMTPLLGLSEYREAWDVNHGTKTDWPPIEEQRKLSDAEVNGQDVPF